MVDLSSPLDSAGVRLLDAGIDRAAGRLRGTPAVDRGLYGLSQAANHSVVWHAINLADATFATAVGGASGRARRNRAIRRSVVLGVEQAVVNGPIKSLFGRTRPSTVTDHPHELRVPLTSSFPSGHASAGACAATLLSRDLGVAPLWWSIAGAVAWSRVHVGAHHASDLIGGAFVGRSLGLWAGVMWPPPTTTTGSAPAAD